MEGIFHLKGTVKNYDWGGNNFIPSLLDLANNDLLPFAEYWMGAHPNDHCSIELPDRRRILLNEYFSKHPEALGKQVQEKFGRLPYLFKVLDVDKMLSIQVHPDKKAAEKEFARENALGIPLDSHSRNYKDDNHKPELMVALSDFWLLHGFKPPEEMTYILLNVVELRELLPIYNDRGYGGLYRHVMEMPQEQVNRILQPLVDNLDTTQENDRYDEDYWALRACKEFCQPGKIDRGIFSIYLLNLVHLKKGGGIFQAPGVPHAYLEGQNVEIMASSDNVLRGGLTHKHIDVQELLKHVKCEPTYVKIIEASGHSAQEKYYETPTDDFRLSVFELGPGENTEITATGAEILLISKGEALLDSSAMKIELKKGSPSAMLLPQTRAKLATITGATVFRAAVP